MIQWVRPTSRYTGKSIWILDQTGYSHVAAEDVAQILTIPKAEVVMTISADRMFRRGRGLKQDEWREALKRYSFLSDDILEMLRNWEETKQSRPALMRILLPRTIAKTRPRTFSCFTLSPGDGRNAVWVLHLVRSNDVEGAIRAQDAMLDCQWRQNGRILVREHTIAAGGRGAGPKSGVPWTEERRRPAEDARHGIGRCGARRRSTAVGRGGLGEARDPQNDKLQGSLYGMCWIEPGTNRRSRPRIESRD